MSYRVIKTVFLTLQENRTMETAPAYHPVELAPVGKRVAVILSVHVTKNAAPMAAVTRVKRQFHRQVKHTISDNIYCQTCLF